MREKELIDSQYQISLGKLREKNGTVMPANRTRPLGCVKQPAQVS